MSTMTVAIFDYVFDLIERACPKFKYRFVIPDGTILCLQDVSRELTAYVGLQQPHYFRLSRASKSADPPYLVIHVPVADPDSLEQVEQFLLECHNQLP